MVSDVEMPPDQPGQQQKSRARFEAISGHPIVSGIIVAIILATFGALWVRMFDGPVAEYVAETDISKITLDVETRPAEFEHGPLQWRPYHYFLPLDIDEVPPPPADCRDRREWASRLGGADANETYFRISLEGNRPGQVKIAGAHVDIMPNGREGGSKGVVVGCQWGGPSDYDGLVINLDEDPPQIRYYPPGSQQPASTVDITLSQDEINDVFVDASISSGSVEWKLVLDVVKDGAASTITIDDGGRPFRTVATSEAPLYSWNNHRWEHGLPYS